MADTERSSTYWYLKQTSLFECLSDAALASLVRIATMHVLPRNHLQPLRSDEPYVYYVKRGHLKVSKPLGDGDSVIIDVLGPGEFFGLIAGDATTMLGTADVAEALDEARVCVFRRADFQRVLEEHPQLYHDVLKHVDGRLVRFQERLVDMAFRPARARVAGFVLRYATDIGYLTHQEIAYLTGLSRQTVTLYLNDLRQAGFIDFDRSGIIVVDRAALLREVG